MTDLETRFWAKVRPGPEAGDCWVWLGARSQAGYGRIRNRGAILVAHRVSYELRNGTIPTGLVIDHLCRNHGCVNPDHLQAVTDRVNVLRGVGPSAANAVATHCPQGHEYDQPNTYVTPSGRRDCRACRGAAVKRYQSRKATTNG